jgi:hypothetical protein
MGKAFQPLGDVVGGGLPFEGGVHREHHLVNASRRDACDKAVDPQILRSHAIQRGQAPAEHMEAPGNSRDLSSAHRSGTSSTTQSARASRRGSVQMPHGFTVSTLPQVEQVESRSLTRSSAWSSGRARFPAS